MVQNGFFPARPFPIHPMVRVCSQSIPFFRKPEFQSYENTGIGLAGPGDLYIGRNLPNVYVEYWQRLIPGIKVLNIHLPEDDPSNADYLTEVILRDKNIQKKVKALMPKGATLIVFLPTQNEEALAQSLGIPLHGTPEFSAKFGTKSGIRALAEEYGLRMPAATICTNIKEIKESIERFSYLFKTLYIKSDESIGGMGSYVLKTGNLRLKKEIIAKIEATFVGGQHHIVVEEGIALKASVSAHIELPAGRVPIICGAWQQIIAPDGKTFLGSVPLKLKKAEAKEYLVQLHAFSEALAGKGAVGSFNANHVLGKDGKFYLVEMNAREPWTATPRQIVFNVRGSIHSNYMSSAVFLSPVPNRERQLMTAEELLALLRKKKLLIETRSKRAKGVVPYDITSLKWNTFDMVAMADDFTEARRIFEAAKSEIFKYLKLGE